MKVEVTVVKGPKRTVMTIRGTALSLTWGMLVWLFPAALYAGAPTDQVRATADRVLEILKDPQFASAAAKQAQRDRLREGIHPRFDFEDMSRRALGQTWRRISKTEQDDFVRLFKQLLEDSYLNNIQGFMGEKILYANEVEESDYARVDTKLLTKEGEPIAINYNLHKVGADWKVYDVVIGNISIVNNYRAQFTRLLGKDSFPEVLSLLREKVAVRGELRTYWTKVQYPKSKMTLYIMRPKRRGRSELNK